MVAEGGALPARAPPSPSAAFLPVACPECGEVIGDALMTGVMRVRCRNRRCGRRVWLIGDAASGRIVTSLVDSAPRELLHSMPAPEQPNTARAACRAPPPL